MNLLSIDPGKQHLAYALWQRDALTRAHLIRLPQSMRTASKWERAIYFYEEIRDFLPEREFEIALEDMEFRNIAAANNVIELQAIAAITTGLLMPEAVTYYRPSQWKGSVSKGGTKAHVERTLTSAERLLIPKLPPSLIHNVYDAIGIGVRHLGR